MLILNLSFNSFETCQPHPNMFSFRAMHSKVCHRVFVDRPVLFVKQLKVEELSQIYLNYFHRHFSECLPEADPFTSAEWYETVRIALFAIRSQEEGIQWVEALRQEFAGSPPLIRVVMQSLEVDMHAITSAYSELANFSVFFDSNCCTDIGWIRESECF